MEVLYSHGEATAAEVFESLPDAPSYNAVRGVLRVLEQKGHVRHERRGRAYVYRPRASADAAGRSRLTRLKQTFFGGSAERVMSALFDDEPPDANELERIERVLERAREHGRARDG